MGGISPINLQGNEFCWNFFSGFENVISLSVILRHLEAELRILKSKMISGGLHWVSFKI
jgi:hypothetical protein